MKEHDFGASDEVLRAGRKERTGLRLIQAVAAGLKFAADGGSANAKEAREQLLAVSDDRNFTEEWARKFVRAVLRASGAPWIPFDVWSLVYTPEGRQPSADPDPAEQRIGLSAEGERVAAQCEDAASVERVGKWLDTLEVDAVARRMRARWSSVVFGDCFAGAWEDQSAHVHTAWRTLAREFALPAFAEPIQVAPLDVGDMQREIEALRKALADAEERAAGNARRSSRSAEVAYDHAKRLNEVVIDRDALRATLVRIRIALGVAS
jgi:hypothetical protein